MNKYFILLLITVTINLLQSCSSKSEKINEEKKWYLGSKQNYTPPSETTPLPKGYQLAFVTNVARHGSRFMGGPGDDTALLELMTEANNQDQLTVAGKKLFLEVKKIVEIQKGNYGNLTPLGKKEHYNMAQRLYKLSPDYFNKAALFIGNATYKPRTQDSRSAFISGLQNKGVKTDWNLHHFTKGNDPLLRYHKISPKHNAYVDSALWEPQINDLLRSDTYKKLTSTLLPIYFKSTILKEIEEGDKIYKDDENEIVIDSKVSVVLALYECLKISFAIPQNIRPNFMIFTPEETKLLSKVGDIEAFYEKGPGFPNRNASYANATTLLLNITHALESFPKGKLEYQGYFNFAHAETTLPLTVLLNLNNINNKTDNLLDKEWILSDYASMGSNIQWFLLEKNDQYYVQVRFNEIPAKLPIIGNQDGVYPLSDYIDYVKGLVDPYQISDLNYSEIVKQF